MTHITLTAHLVAIVWQLPGTAAHTAMRGCDCFDLLADETVAITLGLALRSILPADVQVMLRA